jgi:hypothetical protein
MSLTKATYSLINGSPLNVLDFGAVGNDSYDSTSAIQAAFTAAASSGQSVYIPTGTYKITSSLNITNEIKIYGDGNYRSILKLYTASTTTYALVCNVPDNDSIFGLNIGYLGIIGNGGSAKGSGIYWGTTATNSAISISAIHDMRILNVTTGISLNGVVYMSEFARITVTGVDSYGWITNPISGQVIYNTYQNLEVTDVASNAYAYYFVSPAGYFKNLTCDGCAYFSGAYIAIDGIAVEGIAAATPASSYAISCLQVASVRNVSVINVPTAKCQYALSIEGPNFSLSGVRIPNSGAGNQPARALLLYAGNTGTISDIQFDLAVTDKLEAYLSNAILNGFVFTGCSDITDRNLVYDQSTWTPTYTVGWTTAPTPITALYTRVGRQVTATVYAQNGVSTAGAQIGGLPFTANSLQATAASGCCSSDTTITLTGAVLPSASIISSIPARTLTGQFWVITATYFV